VVCIVKKRVCKKQAFFSDTLNGINDIISRELMMVMLYNYHTKVDNGSGGANANALARFSDRGDVSAGALNAMR
jgi:hypothetical protein